MPKTCCLLSFLDCKRNATEQILVASGHIVRITWCQDGKNIFELLCLCV